MSLGRCRAQTPALLASTLGEGAPIRKYSGVGSPLLVALKRVLSGYPSRGRVGRLSS